MPILDYGRPSPHLHSLIKRVCLVFAIGAFALAAWKAPTWYARYQAYRIARAYRLIDADVPGTEVFLRDKLLGTTPLILSRSRCAALGLPTTPDSFVDHDGWGEGILMCDPKTEAQTRLMLKVPPTETAKYLHYETPWGTRTKQRGGLIFPNGAHSAFQPGTQNGKTLDVSLTFNSSPAAADQTLSVTVRVINPTPAPVTGFRPSLMFLWGTLDVNWQSRFTREFPLPPEWSTIPAGKSLETVVEIPLPTAPGDYSLFGTFHHFVARSGNTLAGNGSRYSDSKLFHIR